MLWFNKHFLRINIPFKWTPPLSRDNLGVHLKLLQVFEWNNFYFFMFKQSVECYDPDTDTWSELSNMNFKRSSFAAVVVDHFIFVLGGLNTTTVERFDTRNGRWELMPAMSTKRLNFGAAQVCGFIYVIGEFTEFFI